MQSSNTRFFIIFVSLTFLLLMGTSFPSTTKQNNIQTSMSPAVAVEELNHEWLIKGQRVKASICKTNLQITVTKDSATWTMLPSAENDLIVELDSTRSFLKLVEAGTIKFSQYCTGYATGIKIEFSQFKCSSEKIELILQLFITLETSQNELVFRIAAIEKRAVIKECRWPKAFTSDSFDFTVVPFMQGMLLPKNWSQKVWLYDTSSYSRGLYMPWWGHLNGNSAVMVILETANDAGCDFGHQKNGPTHIAPKWLHSLGAFKYPRQLRMCFFDRGNYVTLAKRYRKYVMETGHFCSLREKIARTPALTRLIGSPILHTSILYHTVKESSYYDNKHPENNHRLTTFAERINDIRKLKQTGIEKLYLHLDGWGFRGYDNLHPDYLPPNAEAGGWQGMKRFVETCKQMGYTIALHDQYRDYYLDALSYDPRHTKILENGKRFFEHTWAGGAQSILCPSLAPGFVKMNHQALKDHGIQVDGSYLDVFAVVPPEECYSPEHPVTRTQCLQYRAQCFAIIKQLEGIVSSEEPADWAIPYLDLVHHGPYALVPNPGKGPAMGIPIPLFNLVYHDAIILPWSIGQEKGGWGIPDADAGFLHGLLNGGMSYISLIPDEKEMEKVNLLCKLHQRVALLEMTNHEFLDQTYRKQRTTFADGTTVTVDFDSDLFVICPEFEIK